ncbi:MAG TPA: IS4 family transposase [Thermomonospora sp.]|nr:IS4 family transposase [Thermomonospora sp.]
MPSAGGSRRFTDGISIGVLTRIFHRDLVDDVLRETGRAGQRIRLLPGRVIVYFVLALCLFFDDPYEEVMRKLVNGLRFLGNWVGDWHVPTSSAMSQARTRLGEAPLAALFDRVAVPIARPATIGAWFHGRRVMAVDGVVLDTPDTPDNVAAFGRFGRDYPYPQVRLVGLGECGTHAVVAAAFDSRKVTERDLLPRLLPAFTPGMLVPADRGFYSYQLWRQAIATGAEQLWRIKDDLKIPVLEVLPDGSYRSELVPRIAKNNYRRGKIRHVPDRVRIPVRVIEYTVPDRNQGGERIRVMTSILDHEIASAAELAALYQQRWEFELTLDEIEVHQMPRSRLLRSKTPELARQEIWALLLAHYAVRSFMREAADDAGDDVDHLSFIRSLRIIRRQVENQAGFSPSPPAPSHP